MKAILLTGGRGTRLRPLTHTNNKHCLPIANKPLIMYPFMNIVDSGIKEIGVVVNETRDEIEKILGDGSKWGVKITYIFQDEPKGLAHALSLGEKFIGKDDFVMVLGDNMLQGDLKEYISKFDTKKFSGFILGRLVPVKDHKRFGMATLNESGEVVRYVEKPGVVDMSDLYDPNNSFAVAGFYFFTHEVFKCFTGKDKIKPSPRGELEIASPFNWLIGHGYKVGLSHVDGWWKDPGNPEDMFAANKLVLSWKDDFRVEGQLNDTTIEDDIEIMEGTLVTKSKLRGPVSIGKNVKITNSYIGPYTSIGDNCVLENVQIENSILMENCHIQNVSTRLDACLIGHNTQVTESSEYPRASSLIIGDDAKVTL